MRTTWLARFQIVAVGLALSGCRTSVAGHYQLDLEETKRCVDKAAVDNPEDAHMKDGTVKLLAATALDMELNQAGKMLSTTTLTSASPPSAQRRDGTWKLEGTQVKIKVEGEADTICDVDGSRLRCQKPVLYTLFSHYVLVRK